MPERRAHLFWLIPPLLVFMWLGARGLDMDLLWLDEYFSIGNVGGILRVPYNPAEVWVSVSQYSPQHVPGYFFILSGWVALTGWSVFAMRALSLLFALLTIAGTYRLGADWLSPRAGLYAAYILSVSALLVHFAHELRMYTLMALLTVALLWVYRRVIAPERRPRWWEWAGLFLSALGLIWVHYVSVIVVAAVGLHLLLFAPKNRRWLWIAGLLALACLSFLPWLDILRVGARFINVEEDTGVPVLGPAGVLQTLNHLFGNGNIGLLIVTGAFGLLAIRQRGACDVWFFTLAVLALTILINAVVPMISENRPRYLMHLWPPLALVAALGLTMMEKRRWQNAARLFLAAWVVIGLNRTLDPQFLAHLDGPRYTNLMPPLREMIAEANRLGDPDDMLIGFSREQYLFNEVKFGPIAEYYLRDLRMANHFITLPDARPPERIRADLRERIGTRLNVWFATEPVISADNLAVYRAALEADYVRCEVALNRADLRIEHYMLAAFGCLNEQAVPEAPLVQFAGGISLDAVKLAEGPHDQLLAAAYWSVSDSVPPETYSVSFKLWNADDAFITQADDGLRAAGAGWRLAELPLNDLPSGDYTLTVTVYDWRTGVPLAGQAADGTGEIVPVMTVRLPFGA